MRSQISNLAKGLYEEIGVWRNRSSEGKYPYLKVETIKEQQTITDNQQSVINDLIEWVVAPEKNNSTLLLK